MKFKNWWKNRHNNEKYKNFLNISLAILSGANILVAVGLIISWFLR